MSIAFSNREFRVPSDASLTVRVGIDRNIESLPDFVSQSFGLLRASLPVNRIFFESVPIYFFFNCAA